MTGFGRGSASSESKKFTVEIRSLNSKQLDLSLRFPSAFRELEVTMRQKFYDRLQRGKVEATGMLEYTGGNTPVRFNLEVLGNYRKQIVEMSEALSIDTPADWYATLLRLPETLTSEADDDNDNDARLFGQAADEALEQLCSFRKKEGAKLEKFFVGKIDNIRALLAEIEPLEKERVPRIRKKIEEQLQRLTTPEYDHDRLEQELIFYIEKLDVTEEKTRLAAHLDYFLQTLELPEGGQGKKLGFIAQEMGREINTLGSKSNHSGMQKIVVRMKDELEQIKEQVLNVL